MFEHSLDNADDLHDTHTDFLGSHQSQIRFNVKNINVFVQTLIPTIDLKYLFSVI